MKVAHVAAFWALASAALHISWAAGWYPLLAAHPSQLELATPRNWTFNVIAAVVCLIAALVTLAPAASLPRRFAYRVAWTVSALLVLRSAVSLMKIAYFVAAGQFKFAALGLWEPWSYLGAVLFVMTTRRSSRT